MGNYMEIIAVISMVFTAAMLIVLNVLEIKREKEEERLKKAKAAHEEVKRRWKEAEGSK